MSEVSAVQVLQVKLMDGIKSMFRNVWESFLENVSERELASLRLVPFNQSHRARGAVRWRKFCRAPSDCATSPLLPVIPSRLAHERHFFVFIVIQ